MTTPSPFLAWHAEAMRYAEMMADASWANAVAFDDHECEATAHKVAAARAALSAHLLAVPMGEPAVWGAKVNGQWFGYSRSREALVEEIEERLSTTADVVVPQFTKPEGMA